MIPWIVCVILLLTCTHNILSAHVLADKIDTLKNTDSLVINGEKHSSAIFHSENHMVRLAENCTSAKVPAECRHQNVLHKDCCTFQNLADYMKVFCFAINTTTFSDIVDQVSSNIRSLTIILNNKWQGHYPLYPGYIDLTGLQGKTQLEEFAILSCYKEYLQAYRLYYSNHTFAEFVNLKNLTINLSLQNFPLNRMLIHFTALERLDLSYLRSLGMHNMAESLRAVNNNTLSHLYLSHFQLIGVNGYENTLWLSDFLAYKITGRTFRKLKELDLSNNGFARVLSRKDFGISLIAENLEVFNLSLNLLIDAHNDGNLVEAALHPQLKVLDYGYQGYKNRKLGKRQTRDSSNFFTFLQPDKGHAFALSCANKYALFHGSTTANVSALAWDKKVLSNILSCILPWQFQFGPSYNILPHLNETNKPGCSFLLEFPMGQNLEEILFNNVHYENAITVGRKVDGHFCIAKNKVKRFNISGNAAWMKSLQIAESINCIHSISGLEGLQVIDISYNCLNINISLFSNGTFFTNLTHFYAAGNYIRLSPFCNNQASLELLDLSYNDLGAKHSLTPVLFEKCGSLQTLNLSGNNLYETSIIWTFSNLQNLQMLNLSNNLVKTLETSFLERLLVTKQKVPGKSPLVIDIENNPLICNCSHVYLTFMKWAIRLQASKKNSDYVSFHNFNSYKCSGPKGMMSLNKNTQAVLTYQCMKSTINTEIAIAILILVILISLTYKYRWRIKYKFFCLRQRLTSMFTEKSTLADVAYQYDAFISYSDEDRFWVHDALVKTLENTYGFKLCIHFRDFPVGESIANTIVSSMQNSRDIILIVSDTFLQDEWCQFAMNQGILQSLRRHTNMIIIKLGNLHKDNFIGDSKLANILDTHAYLEWVTNGDGKKLFWANLVQKLYGNSSSCACNCPSWRFTIKQREYEKL